MIFLSIEEVTQWPYWILCIILLSSVFLTGFSWYSLDKFNRFVLVGINFIVALIALYYGIKAGDYAVAIFFGLISFSGLTLAFNSKVNGIILKSLITGWIVCLFAIFLYFDVFEYVYFDRQIYINSPFRLYLSGYLLWGGFVVLVAIGAAYYWAFSSHLPNFIVFRNVFLVAAIAFFGLFFAIKLIDNNYSRILDTLAFDSITEHIYYGVGVDAKNKHGATKLFKAVESEDFERVQKLIEAGASINIEGGNHIPDKTPLMRSIVKRNFKIFKYLLDQGADVNQRVEYGFYPILLLNGSHKSDRKYLDYLLANGADLSVSDRFGNSLIHNASSTCYDINKKIFITNSKYLEYLITRGADIQADGQFGTPLHSTVRGGCYKNAEKLISLGANPFAMNKEKMTAAEMADHLVKATSRFKFESAKRKNIKRKKISVYLKSIM